MSLELIVPLAVILFVALLVSGRKQIAQGANASVANGGVLLVLAMVAGVLALGLVLSLDVW